MEFKRVVYEIPRCSICFDECLKELGILECGHVFHYECVLAWNIKEKSCPLCRKKVSMVPSEILFHISKKEVDDSESFASLFQSTDKSTLEELLVFLKES